MLFSYGNIKVDIEYDTKKAEDIRWFYSAAVENLKNYKEQPFKQDNRECLVKYGKKVLVMTELLTEDEASYIDNNISVIVDFLEGYSVEHAMKYITLFKKDFSEGKLQ